MRGVVRLIHERALVVAGEYKSSESELISIFQEMDKHRGYFEFEVTSLHAYGTEILKLSENVVSHLISIARKSRDVPALQEAIARGSLTISKARKIVPVLTKENQDEWLQIATTQTSRQIEKAVATANPMLAVQESVRYRSEDRLELKLGISEDFLKALEWVMDFESQRTSKAASREDALRASLEAYREKNDPVRKANRSVVRKEKMTKRDAVSVPGPVKPKERPALSARIIQAIDLRDQRRCTYRNSLGERCARTRWLDYHHLMPRSRGGKDALENLRTVCSGHHRMIHSSEH